jgi:superfamily II DNA or RNA helicase
MDNQSEVTVEIGNVFLRISGLTHPDIIKDVQNRMSYVIPGYKFTPVYKKDPSWDGTKTVARRFGSVIQAPTGLFSYLKEVLNAHNIPLRLMDCRPLARPSTGYSYEGFVPWDYQRPIIDAILNRQRGVAKLATGGGKTEIAVAVAVEAAAFPFIFYVPSCDLLEQAYTRFKTYVRFNGAETNIGRVGAGYCDLQPITIMTVQSAQRALEGTFTKFDDESADDKTKFDENQRQLVKDFIHEAQFVAVDECQHTSAATVQSVMNHSFGARYRIGFSASPWRDDGLDILIEACFGRRLCDIDASFLIQKRYLCKPEITFNHLKQTLSPCATYQEQYKTYVVENDFRNGWIAQRALHHIGQGRMTIILVKWVRHAEILADLIPGAEILSSSGESKKSPAKRKLILERMRSKELMCAIGTSLLDEGVDVPAATAGIFAGGGKSSTRALQRVGRFIRKDKEDKTKDIAYIEEIHDHCMFLNHHAQMRRKILSTEREFLILDNRIPVA